MDAAQAFAPRPSIRHGRSLSYAVAALLAAVAASACRGTPEPVDPVRTAAVPPELIPVMLTPTLLEGLHAEASEMAAADLPGNRFGAVEISVWPLASGRIPGVQVEVSFAFRDGGTLQRYRWDDRSGTLRRSEGRDVIFALGAGSSGPCATLPWQGSSDHDYLVRHAFTAAGSSFRMDAGSHYSLYARAWENECHWQIDLWEDDPPRNQSLRLGHFYLEAGRPTGALANEIVQVAPYPHPPHRDDAPPPPSEQREPPLHPAAATGAQ